MSSTYSVSLLGPAPWGFRLQGGKDFNMPLTISRLMDQGKAAKARVAIGDVVLSIDGISTDGMNHLEAQNKIKACSGNLSLTLQRATPIPKPPVAPKAKSSESVVVPSVPTNLSPNAPHKKHTWPFWGCGLEDRGYPTVRSPLNAINPATPAGTHPSSQLPFPPPSSSSSSSSSSPPTLPAAPQPSIYNKPLSFYSDENAGEVAMGQRRGLMESQARAVQVNGATRKPIIHTDIEFYHVPSHGDASKKRLMEDTEDWHPRSGTTQSRSFRILAQITGTEHHESPEKPKDSGSQTKEEGEEPGSVDTGPSSPTKSSNNFTPTKGMTGSGFSKPGIQKGVIAPSIEVRGSTYASGPPRCPVPERPVRQIHPKDEDSLVQMAEHIPAGRRTPMCGHCNKVIRGPFLVAMGKSWHPEEFNCAHCHTSLADIGFVEERASVFCENCYEEFLAPTCSRCQTKILGEVINALKQAWHVHCFLCVSCQQPIRNNTFHLEDGEPYCETDYYSLFGTGCHGCEFPIEAGDKFLEALGFTWHDTCFVCAVCCTTLEGQAFFSKMDKPLCKKHAHSVIKM